MKSAFDDEIIELASDPAGMDASISEMLNSTDIDQAIHEAVLAAKERAAPKIRKSQKKRPRKPDLTIKQILEWADEHHARTGKWPRQNAGAVPGTAGETWTLIHNSLSLGCRGLPGGVSLAQLLEQERDARNCRRPPGLTLEAILKWADAFYAKRGKWPGVSSGTIDECPEDSWVAIDIALRRGTRGLPGKSSVARLLAQERGARNNMNTPGLTHESILTWADAFFRRHGHWPTQDSGPIEDSPEDTWRAIHVAMFAGLRGLPGGISLSMLLQRERGVRDRKHLQNLYVTDILMWIDAYHERNGAWPQAHSGPIPESQCDTWNMVDSALREGRRRLPGGSSLFKLLSSERGVNIRKPPTVQWRSALPSVETRRSPQPTLAPRRPTQPPQLTIDMILAWADSYHELCGKWPTGKSGPVAEHPEFSWLSISNALKQGFRGLPGGSSLARLLDQERGVRNRTRPPGLSIEAILISADAYHARHGKWPNVESGPVPEYPGESWRAIHAALAAGSRGLPGGSSLAKLLEQERGARNGANPPPLTFDTILAWADGFYARQGKWPRVLSGPVPESPGDNWCAIHASLKYGHRGLPGGSSLARLLVQERGARNYARLPRLTTEMILSWADAYHARNDKWPGQASGSIEESQDDTWLGVNQAFVNGHRGLPGGESLATVLERDRGARNRIRLRRLSEDGGSRGNKSAHARLTRTRADFVPLTILTQQE